MTSLDVPVHSWACSYYMNDEKRWVNGRLFLTLSAIRFGSSPGGDSVVLLLPLSRIALISTESSCFIFSAVTLQERDGPKHWFCSLKPSVGAVRQVLQHFWKAAVTQNTLSTNAPLSKGQKLISMVSDAQNRLSQTGRVLNQQGEQFNHMIDDLDKMQSDLGVADKLLSELESPTWWPFGKLPWNRKNQSELAKAKSPPPEGVVKSVREIISVPVVFYRGADVNTVDVNSGSLLALVSSLEIRDAAGRLVHHFHKQEVDEIRIHGACDISVRQRHIGQPDVCFRLLSARMAEAMCVLEMQYKKKVEFASDCTALQTTPSDDITPGNSKLWDVGASSDMDLVPVPEGELTPVQLQVQRSSVSEAEAQELKQMLLQLKSLAMEAESELDRQGEALDVLVSSSDRASIIIDKETRRMRKLL